MSAIRSELSADLPPVEESTEEGLPAGIGPYRLAWRRLRRNKVSLFFGGVFILIVILCLLAPVYSHDVAHIGPDTGNLTGQIKVGGKLKYILSLQGIPIGPTWDIHHYFLGADSNGRDVAVRLLYGGRSSLEIGVVATLLTMFFGTAFGIIAGFFRGVADGFISRISDVIWSYPAVLLGITLGTVLNVRGLGPFHSTTLLTTALVVGFVASSIIVFIPLILANAIILEAALSYLGAGVQPPNSSWGTMIESGLATFPGAFHTVLAPGIMLVLAVMSINIFGDGLRDALDPRSKAAS
jgi:peptide/nickel transport system permease protein